MAEQKKIQIEKIKQMQTKSEDKDKRSRRKYGKEKEERETESNGWAEAFPRTSSFDDESFPAVSLA